MATVPARSRGCRWCNEGVSLAVTAACLPHFFYFRCLGMAGIAKRGALLGVRLGCRLRGWLDRYRHGNQQHQEDEQLCYVAHIKLLHYRIKRS